MPDHQTAIEIARLALVKIFDAVHCVRSSHLDDWFLVQRVVHDGSTWETPVTICGMAGHQYHTAARLVSDTDIEGDAAQLREVAVAIRARINMHFKRIAVRRFDDGFLIWSPRNSSTYAWINDATADALAVSIDSVTASEVQHG